LIQENIQPKKEDEIYCPSCAKPIKKGVVVCPHCGVQVKDLRIGAGTEEPYDESKVVQLLMDGNNRAVIIKELIKQNWTKEKASKFVNEIETKLKKESKEYRIKTAKRYRINMLIALVITIVGIIITYSSYNAYSSTGGTWVVCWGAVVFGIIYFFIGLIGWLRYRG